LDPYLPQVLLTFAEREKVSEERCWIE